MPITIYLDSHAGKVMVMLETADRAEVDDRNLRFFEGERLIAVFNRDKVFGYEVQRLPGAPE
ncbi:hypothetical protein FJY71_10045 [candidate division WOR-3 bacterium]|nr:hypothetical protein [candidate division WOR-3 bacterium]